MAVGSFKLPMGSGGSNSSATPYERPADWLAMPTPDAQEVIGLMAVYDDGGNYVAFNCQGNYTVDWGDGTAPVNYASGTTASYQHTFASLPSGTLTSKGFRQALVRITPQAGQNLTSVVFGTLNATLNKSYSPGWLEFDIRAPNGIVTWGGGSNIIRYARLEKIVIRELGAQNPQNLFSNLYNLRSVYIEPSEMTGRTAFNNMFSNCYALEEAPFFDTSSATNTVAMFQNCYSLKVVPNYNLASTTSVSSMFDGCVSLETVPAFVLGTSVSSLFANCYSLIETPAFNTSNVTNFTSMFFQCTALEKVALFDTSKGIDFTSMFNTCRSLKSVPQFNTELGQNFTSMFASCNLLTDVPLFNMVSATNLTGMFNGCNNIMYLPALNTANVTTLSQTFNNCWNLRELPAINVPLVLAANFTTWIDGNTTLSRSLVYGATKTHSYNGRSLSQASIVTIFTNLGTSSPTGQTITVTNNPGRAALTAPEIAIATAKGWTVV
jgi:hypothetical protein